MFDRQPLLEGESIRARPLRPDDFAALYAVARDPLVWAQHPDPERHRPGRFQAFFAQAVRSGGALVVETLQGDVIGSSRFHDADLPTGEVEIGWTFLARSRWGDGTNRALKSLMLDHAFCDLERVVFRVGPENRRSQRALEKLGAVRLGECSGGAGNEAGCRRRRPCEDPCARSAVFVITRDTWRSSREATAHRSRPGGHPRG